MMENYYNCIYMYINKENGKRYIGQTINFNRRHKSHVMPSASKTPIDRAFNKYGEDGFDIVILAHDVPKEKLDDYEKFFIKRYNTLVSNGEGYNVTIGGSCGSNYVYVKTEAEMEVTRTKMKEKRKGRTPNKGNKHTKLVREKMSNSHKGQKPNLGKGKPILQCDLDGNIIKRFNSAKQASDELNLDSGRIGKCCRKVKGYNTYHGFIFKFERNDEEC